ncbi:Gfo/Idh/MocA family protein [Verrucomicrobiota bacterium]
MRGKVMQRLRTAVIGLGRIGWQFHVPQIMRHDGFELTAVVDPLDKRLAEARSEFGVKGYADADTLLQAESLDLVVIASPTHFHADHAIAAFEHGSDVFCDKPMAPSLEEANRMAASMKKHGRKLMIYQPRRAGSDIVALREVLRQDLIGPVYMIKRAGDDYTRRNDWQAFRKHGGGMLNNFGAHAVDQLLYLAGSSAKHVACSLRSIACLGDADDVVKAVIETENGIILDVDINMASAHSMTPWHILGERGSIILDSDQNAWCVRFFRPEELPDLAVQEGFAAVDRRYGSGETIPWREKVFPFSDVQPVDYFQKCYEYFALDKDPFVPLAESLEVMRVLDVCRKDAQGTSKTDF